MFQIPRVPVCVVAIGLCMFATPALAEWTEPKDGVMTDKQVAGYVAVMKEWIADMKAADKAVQGQSGLAAAAVLIRTSEKYQKSIASQGMTEPEFEWVRERVFEAWGGVMRQDMLDKMKDELGKQVKTNQDKILETKQKVALHQKAQKEGRRVMTPDERKSAVDSATEEQKSALDEAKQHADEVKAAEAEVAKTDTEQKAAEAALKNPPKFDDADARTAFIEEKKNAIQAAKDARKEAQDKIAEARKAEAESRAKALASAARIKDPDLPITDEDKAQVKQQNEEAIKQLTEEINNTEAGNKLLQETIVQQSKAFGDESTKVPPQNLTLFKKHQKEFEELLGIKK